MNFSYCRFCGRKIPKYFYANALFCSDLCRKRYYDVKKRPESNQRAVKFVKGVVENERL